ncbi:cytochrome P450 1A2-like isoform X2 [Dreissena polymorpha]|uniref:cytochrome P450 1A2-like isoform X2 n=1 Tax=Dreissena polymorpha TaxID=45954 RepID=UPI00226418A3|nr:cytochrome P450 1A2-like isoform X2 [Dreissena polymorpha]
MTSPPGPRGLPVFGQAFNLDKDHMHLTFMEWQKRYGDLFMFKIMGQDFLVVSHPDILRKLFDTCEHAKAFNDRARGFMSKYVIHNSKDILFRNMDEKQQYLKTKALDYFENQLVEEKWFYSAVAEEMRSLVSEMECLVDKEVDIVRIMDTMVIKIMGLLLTGNRITVSSREFESLSGFIKPANEMAKVKNHSTLTKLPMLRKIPGNLKNLYDTLEARKKDLRDCFLGTTEQGKRGLVFMLRSLRVTMEMEDGESWIDNDFIMGVVMDLIPAAIVPLQNTISVLFLVLVHNPEVQNKIREQVTLLKADVTIDDIRKLPYIEACILELKRFHTPLPVSARHCNRSGNAVFEKYSIPKNTEIFSNLFGIHHDERFFDDPWSFRPERFMAEDGSRVGPEHPVMKNMVVTGVGPRRCLGSTFSEKVIFLVVTILLKYFRICPNIQQELPPCDPRKLTSGVVTKAPDFNFVFQLA